MRLTINFTTLERCTVINLVRSAHHHTVTHESRVPFACRTGSITARTGSITARTSGEWKPSIQPTTIWMQPQNRHCQLHPSWTPRHLPPTPLSSLPPHRVPPPSLSLHLLQQCRMLCRTSAAVAFLHRRRSPYGRRDRVSLSVSLRCHRLRLCCCFLTNSHSLPDSRPHVILVQGMGRGKPLPLQFRRLTQGD